MLSAVLLLGVSTALAGLLAARVARRSGIWWAALAGGRTEADLASQFVFISSARLLYLTLALAATAGLVTFLLGFPLLLSAAVMIVCLTVPRLMVRKVRTRRRLALARQLPDGLALWGGMLRAGHGNAQALAQVSERQAAPLGDELRLVLGQMRLGIPVEAAFAGLCERAELADLRLLETLLATHRELGGNLAESLQRLAELLRGRIMMEQRIQSLTAQGRMQGLVVGLLPLLLLAVLYVMEPEAMRVLHTTWQGWLALACIALLEAVGFVLIRRIVKVDI